MKTEPSHQTRNGVWVDTLLRGLRHAGVKRAVVSPGGRSAALVLGFERNGIEVSYVATDERAGGFFALGLSRALMEPVALCVTSGSAAANLLPSLTEANPSGVPLIVLTADRLQRPGGGVPQTIDHAKLLAGTVGGSLALPEPDISHTALENLRNDLDGFLAPLKDPAQRGPLHINVPLHGVFTSADADPEFASHTEVPPRPYTKPPSTPGPLAPPPQINLPRLTGRRFLVVAGADCPLSHDEVARLISQLEAPLLADLASGLRHPRMPNLISEADALILLPSLRNEIPDLILRLGAVPLSITMQRYLAEVQCPVVHITRDGSHDYLSMGRGPVLPPDHGQLEHLLTQLGTGDSEWRIAWMRHASRFRSRLESTLQELPWGECQAAALACSASGYEIMHVANSMSARHANIFMTGRNGVLRTFMNRGINGIDGTISTFLGELRGCDKTGLLLIGDQAMLHDLTGLQATAMPKLRGTICIVNNRGGALFDLFGLNSVPDHERLIRNPTDLDFAAIARAFNLAFKRCQNLDEFRQALYPPKDGVQIIEAVVPANSLLRDLDRLWRTALDVD